MSVLPDKYGPEVQRVSAETPIEDIIYLLKRDGGVFIKGLIHEPDVDQAYEECRERLDNDVEWCGSFFPSKCLRYRRGLPIMRSSSQEFLQVPDEVVY